MTEFPEKAIVSADISDLTRLASGKVRDIFAVDESSLAIVASDRLSAFDVILPDPIPGKGAILTALSLFWFEKFNDVVANHLSGKTLGDVSKDTSAVASLGSRTMVVKRLTPLPVEAVVRGYIIGSGWQDYQRSGAVCGQSLPEGMQLADKLQTPLFTPATKAAVGDHDENISFDVMQDLIGSSLAESVKDISIELYERASLHAADRGIILADTKFEFGLDDAGVLHLIDEVLTPDSSRYWDAAQYQPGKSPASFDKQIVRDHLLTLNWDRSPPGPALPADIITRTRARYIDVYERLTGVVS